MTEHDTSGRQPVVPPALYLPTTGATRGGEVQVELREMADGRRALLAYTALDRLAECCGPNQPWTLVLTERMDDMGMDYDVVYLDLEIPAELRRGEAR